MNATTCKNCGRERIGEGGVTIHGNSARGYGAEPGVYCSECARLVLGGWFAHRAAFVRENRESGAEPPRLSLFVHMSSVCELVSRSGSHYFEPDTMRFFRSRAHNAYGAPDEGRNGAVYFVTSEQFVPSRGYPEPRKYTVRRLDLTDCEIGEAAGGFQAWDTLAKARLRAMRLAKGEPLDKRRGFKRGAA